jgi:glutamate-1-semialdehyde 2,1-aminomutase
MTSAPASSLDEIVAGLLLQPWVIDLFTDLTARQAGSVRLADQLRERDVSNHGFWPFHAPQFPLTVVAAHGSRITDVDGTSYLDTHLGFGAQALHGHTPEPVVQFVRDRMATSPGNGYLHPIELDFVTLLHDLLPRCETFAFLNSGTDATHAALRLARAYTGRRLVAKFEGALHGVHDIAAHNTAFWYHGQPGVAFPPVGANGIEPVPALAGVPRADQADLLVLPFDRDGALDLIQRHRGELAAVIAEPVSSAFPYEESCVPVITAVSEACHRADIPFILDEVLTGFRYGIGGAANAFDITADLYCYGKVLSGLGLPLSAVGGRAHLLNLTQTSGMALTDVGVKTCVQTSHAGNYLSLCAGYASIRHLAEQGEEYYRRTRENVTWVQQKLAAFRAQHGIPLRLLGFGDFIGSFAFVAEDSYPTYRGFARAVNPIGLVLLTLLLRQRGVYALSLPLLFTGGAHTREDLAELVAAVTDAALELDRHGFPFVLPTAADA